MNPSHEHTVIGTVRDDDNAEMHIYYRPCPECPQDGWTLSTLDALDGISLTRAGQKYYAELMRGAEGRKRKAELDKFVKELGIGLSREEIQEIKEFKSEYRRLLNEGLNKRKGSKHELETPENR